MERRDTRNTVRGSTVNGPVYQAGSMHFHAGDPPAVLPAGLAGVDWARAVFDSAVWAQVPADRDPAGVVRLSGAAVAARLAAVRDEACAAHAPDPWYEPELAVRFLARVEWLLGEPPADGGTLDLYPAEAALFTLAPFLYQAHALDLAARLAPLRPRSLRRSAEPSTDRRSFEAFADGYGVLVARALRRPAAEGPIGWWLFHRWLLHSAHFAAPDAIARLVARALPGAEDTAVLGDVLTPERVGLLVHGLRRGPDVCNPDHLGRLRADERVRGPGSPVAGRGRVREQRLCLLLALAYAAAAESTALPEIVVEHLGIPHPVDLGRLRETLAEAEWGGTAELPVLRAACHHEAVIEGLRAYVARADELLLAVARTVRERVTAPVPALPARLSADGLAPARGVFSGWARFTLDERRIRSLLMGVQLYKDPGLAVRELYQNALDACRFRRARSRYLDATTPATYPYEGAVTITQATDDEGRAYVECRDNGVGMGEAELRGVFANAGARFPEQADFRQEFAAWREHGIGFHPNSRFGIGVLSYFMLADEIRVTTCRMSRTGALGPLLQVSIFGPGHLFRITELAERGTEPGTAVRLYLREGEFGEQSGWSCVQALERVLGIAEFATTAVHGDREARWEPGRLRAAEEQPRWPDRRSLQVGETLGEWAGAPEGVDLVWCRKGGALLVDGLLVDNASDSLPTFGVVLNLSGPHAPERLSADRSTVLDDISEQRDTLLRQAADALAADRLPEDTHSWLRSLAKDNPRVADHLSAALTERRRTLQLGGHTFDLAAGGFLPADVGLLADTGVLLPPFGLTGPFDDDFVSGPVPDSVFLWRLLAHRPHPALTALAAYCPELDDVPAVLPALPSDSRLLTTSVARSARSWEYEDWFSTPMDEPALLGRATRLGVAYLGRPVRATALRRYAEVRDRALPEAAAEIRAAGHTLAAHAESLAAAMLTADGTWLPLPPYAESLYVDSGRPVPLGHLAAAAERSGETVRQVCARLAAYGLAVRPGGLPDRPDRRLVLLLSEDLNGDWPWLDDTQPPPPGHLLAAAAEFELPVGEIRAALTAVGFPQPLPFPADAGPDDLPLLRGGAFGPPGEPWAYGPVLDFAAEHGLPPGDVLARLEQFGYGAPLRVPRDPGLLDRQLLDPERGLPWHEIRAGEPVPFHRVLTAAERLRVDIPEVTERLASYGLQCRRSDLPPGLGPGAARVLLEETVWRDDRVRYDPDGDHLPGAGYLHRLAKLTHSLGVSLPQVVEWLRALDVEVPDLPATVRAALVRVPMAG